MWTQVTDLQQALQALRHPHDFRSRAVHRDPSTGTTTPLSIKDGSVTIDRTQASRRMLDLTLAPEQTVWDALDVPGGEITVTQDIIYVDGRTDTVPLGIFRVDRDEMGYAPGDAITLTCPDRWIVVERNRFGLSRGSVPTNASWQEIKRLVEGAWPSSSFPFPGWAQLDQSATTKVGSLLWSDGDRAGAALQLASDNGLDLFFDAQGMAVLRPTPVLSDSSAPVWVVDQGAVGVLVSADRTRDWSGAYNAVIVTTSATDVTFSPVEVTNTLADDPLRVNGPLGYVPAYYSSPTLRSSAQALAAGKKLMSGKLGSAKQLTLGAAPNPLLDADDVIVVVLPQIDRSQKRPVELHILDQVTVPLLPSGGAQQLLTRSTRPSADLS